MAAPGTGAGIVCVADSGVQHVGKKRDAERWNGLPGLVVGKGAPATTLLKAAG